MEKCLVSIVCIGFILLVSGVDFFCTAVRGTSRVKIALIISCTLCVIIICLIKCVIFLLWWVLIGYLVKNYCWRVLKVCVLRFVTVKIFTRVRFNLKTSTASGAER